MIFHGTHSFIFCLESERRPRIARHLLKSIFRGQRGLRVLFSAARGEVRAAHGVGGEMRGRRSATSSGLWF